MRIIAIILILVFNSCSAQVKKNSAFCCYQKVANITRSLPAGTMKKVNRGKAMSIGYKIDEGQELIIRSTITDRPIDLHSKEFEISDWNEAVIMDSMVSYLSKDNKYLVCFAPIKDATGLAINFSEWIFIDLTNGNFNIYQNFRSAPFMIYNSNQGLVFYLFDYSENFLNTRDYNNLSLIMNEYHWKCGKDPELAKKVDLNCVCNNVKQ